MVASGSWLPAHALVESFSVLTRLPAPFRLDPMLVADYLRRAFADRVLTLPAQGYADLPRRFAAAGLSGGRAYDALIAATCNAHEATLATLDLRAARTYDLLNCRYRLLGDVL